MSQESDHKQIAIVEVLNETLKERYFGVTESSADKFIKSLASGSPGALSHWNPSQHAVYVRFLHYAIARNKVEAFIAKIRDVTPRAGWKDIVGEV